MTASSQGYFRLDVRGEASGGGVRSLQDLCRSNILKGLTLRRVQQVVSLPLPSLLCDFIATFKVPDDFDMSDTFVEYNFSFPNHVHHRRHQIHPGVCTFDGSKVLIKVQQVNRYCETCSVIGEHTMLSAREREKWLHLRHENLMNCLLGMLDARNERLCYVMEFPLFTLQEFTLRVHSGQEQTPEYLVWLVFYKLASVVSYLQSCKVNASHLCQPQHVVIDQAGEVKLENLLLYLPSEAGLRYRTEAIRYTPNNNSSSSCLLAPEQLVAGVTVPQTTIWGLGCIIGELVAADPQNPPGAGYQYARSPIAQHKYSQGLKSCVYDCLSVNLRQRPSLCHIKHTAHQHLKRLEKKYKGPRNLLDFFCEYIENIN